MNIDLKRKKEKRNTFFRWLIYYLIMLIEYIFMTTVNLSSPLPLLLLSTSICISVFEDPFDSAMTGCVAGLLLDAAEGTLVGMNGIILMWCCLMSSLLFYFILRKHILNVLAISAAAVIVQTGFRYLFYYAIWEYDRTGKIFVKEFVPVIILTIVTTVFIFPIIRLLSRRLGKIKENYIEEKSDDIVRE